MASNLRCVGLGVQGVDELTQMLSDVLPGSVSLGIVDGIDVRRWEDPSGARLVLGLLGNEVKSLLPSFAAPAGAHLAGLQPLSDGVAVADVVDSDGETLTRLALELEEQRFLGPSADGWQGAASIVALGGAVTLHASEDAFAASPASLLDSEDEGSDPPENYVERGMTWPPRMGAESFISYGLFGEPDAHARLHGTVRSSERRVVVQTGQGVVVSAVETVGFTALVCTPADVLGWQPAPGNILGGSVFMVGSVPALAPG